MSKYLTSKSSEQQIKNHNYEIDLPDLMMNDKGVDDIPAKFFKRVSHPLPYQGIIIDRDRDQKLFRHAMKYTNEVTEDHREALVEKINSYFPENPSKEKAVVT